MAEVGSVELVDVTKRFGTVVAVDGIDLSVNVGEFLISDLKSAIRDVTTDIRDIKTDISELRAELKSDLRETELRLSQRMDGIDLRLSNHDLRFDNVHEALRQQTRTFILATTGTMVTLSGLAFGAAALL